MTISTREELEALFQETEDTHFVFDGRGLHRSFTVAAGPIATENDVPKYSMLIHSTLTIGTRAPKDGDMVVFPLESGKKGLFVLYNINHAGPNIVATFKEANAVLINNDYEGGFGIKGQEPEESCPSLQVG